MTISKSIFATLQTMPQLRKFSEMVLSQLQNQKEEIYDEIAAYPPPIPACDVQFNYLLEQRAGVGQATRQLKAIVAAEGTRDEIAKQIEAFIAACPYVDAALLRA